MSAHCDPNNWNIHGHSHEHKRDTYSSVFIHTCTYTHTIGLFIHGFIQNFGSGDHSGGGGEWGELNIAEEGEINNTCTYT